jgi:glycosyltransferase involved in cell wall biosynthesis
MSKRLGIFVSHPIQYFAPLWRCLAARPGLSVRVHFFSDHGVRGGQDAGFKMPVARHAADVLVLPSVYETWGLVVNEAMHFRLPAIANSGVGSATDLIRDGETGRVFSVGDAKELADRLEAFLPAPERAREMGAAAGDHIRRYSTEASATGITQALGLKI